MSGPLKHLKILDFTTLLPGPYATMLLADMGAEVVRVESPDRADMLKLIPPMHDHYSYAHHSINRNKRSIALDLKSPHSRSIVLKLLEEYDILIEQFRPGVMKSFGLDYAQLKQSFPNLIYCSISGYGQNGEYKNKAGHDINYLALSGLASYTGRKAQGPAPCGIPLADIAGGSHHAVMGILAAEISRQQTSLGQYLDISICDAAFSLNSLYAAGALATGCDPGYEDQLLNGGHYYDYYRTSDNRYISVGALEPKFAATFLQVIGCEHWIDKVNLFTAPSARLKEEISQKFLKHSYHYWKEVFVSLDACVEPVLSITEAAEHPVIKNRQMLIEVPTNKQQKILQIAPVIKFSENRSDNYSGRALGEDSISVLSEIGFSKNSINRFVRNKTISTHLKN